MGASRKTLMALVRSMDLTMEETDRDIYLDSPRGKVFKANWGHALVAPYANTGQSWKLEAYSDLIERLSYGLEDCNAFQNDNCEVCNEGE